MTNLLEFYNNKKVFITGHTGFKGAWMCKVLALTGARVIGYSLIPPTDPSLFVVANIEPGLKKSIVGDIRNLKLLQESMQEAKPDIVIHMAAQPLVRESYREPVYTYATNVMGTVNLLEAVRNCPSVKSVVNVTTDKVYLNNEWEWGYRENDVLNGLDPYSNSKSCSELITHSYKRSFFANRDIAISTARAGNVIGGGDFAKDRIIPDCVRAVETHKNIVVRNQYSTRPYQHVLEPVIAYLFLAMQQYKDIRLAGSYNIGPNDIDCITTGDLVDLFCSYWGDGITWEYVGESNAPHEANYLKLDCSKIKKALGWSAIWHISDAVVNTIEWSKAYLRKENVVEIMDKQIKDFLEVFDKQVK